MPSEGGVVLRPLQVDDLTAVTEVHLTAFPDSALTKLGQGAVRRYYRWQLTGPHDSLALAAVSNGHLAGFCIGGVFRGATSGFIQHNLLYLTGCMLARPWLLFSPLVRDRIQASLHILRLPGRRKPRPTAVAKRPKRTRSYGILAVAVDPRRQGSGVGRILMERAEDNARKRGFDFMHLTVHPSNLGAVKFYERLGWIRDTDSDEWQGQMLKRLS